MTSEYEFLLLPKAYVTRRYMASEGASFRLWTASPAGRTQIVLLTSKAAIILKKEKPLGKADGS